MDLEELEEPKKPQIPENPLNYALRKQNEKQLESLTRMTKRFYGGSVVSSSMISPMISSRLIRNISNVNRNIWVDQYKNQVTIKLTKISHTRTIVINDDILVAPLKSGKFKIKVSVICDEFKEPENFDIPIEIK